jgi:signal transduction histidine kinase
MDVKPTNISIDVDEDVKIYSNEHLYFAIENVIDNSFRHNDEDVSVDITTELGESGEYVSLSITDDGDGIPDIEKRIITSDVSIDKLNHGDGLGLWIIKWATEMNNVEVDVITKDISGTKFIFYFKLAE